MLTIFPVLYKVSLQLIYFIHSSLCFSIPCFCLDSSLFLFSMVTDKANVIAYMQNPKKKKKEYTQTDHKCRE